MRLARIVIFIWLASTVHSARAPTPGPPPGSPEQQLFLLVNQARQQQGLGPLKWEQHLADAAEVHSSGMVHFGSLSHDLPGEPPLRSRLAVAGAHFDRV